MKFEHVTVQRTKNTISNSVTYLFLKWIIRVKGNYAPNRPCLHGLPLDTEPEFLVVILAIFIPARLTMARLWTLTVNGNHSFKRKGVPIKFTRGPRIWRRGFDAPNQTALACDSAGRGNNHLFPRLLQLESNSNKAAH
jgi:hypothetical protein